MGAASATRRAGVSQCNCFSGLLREEQPISQKEFEQCVEFLSKVPLFHLQLPRAERPKVARALKRIVWETGEEIIKQGQNGNAFFLIMKGTASVLVELASGEVEERATLSPGDHFGGRTLTERRPNVATIIANERVTTLTMNRQDFERLGLNKKLRFPYRPAIYEGRAVRDKAGGSDSTSEPGSPTMMKKSKQEMTFLCTAIKQNANLRALTDLDEETLTSIAEKAQARQVKKGMEIARSGEHGQEFFVIAKGSFEVIPATYTEMKGERSAEAMIARTTMIQRLVRKQHFMASMLATKTFSKASRAQSMMPVQRSFTKTATPFRRNSSTDDDAIIELRRQKKASSKEDLETFRNGETNGADGFHVGDNVQLFNLQKGCYDKVGCIVSADTGHKGQVVVEFKGEAERQVCHIEHLRLSQEVSVGTLGSGDSFGELSLLYNTRREATVRAREDAKVYTISRQKFKDCFSRASPYVDEYVKLLDEVAMLQQLLSSERYELARNATGWETFEPDQVLIVDGKARTAPHFYVIEKGSCVISKGGEQLVCLTRGCHFGERAIIRNDEASEADVKAGPDGLTCLVIDGEILKSLHLKFDGRDVDKGVPDVSVCIYEYYLYRLRAPSTSVASKHQLDAKLEDLRTVVKLGGGGFGEVFLVRHPNGDEYALKRMSKGYVKQQRAVRQIMSERDTLMNCDSPFIVRLFQTFKDEQFVYMLLEAATGGELYELLVEHPKVLLRDNPRGSAALFYVGCITEALGHLHERCIAYRDLKLENILLDTAGYLKLCDMGFARFCLGKTSTLLGTPQYLAPEMIDFPHAHDGNVDWWSLGVVAFELLTLQSPWDNEGHDGSDIMAELLAIRRSHEAGPDVHLIPAQMMPARDFIKRLLSPNPRRRLGAQKDAEEIREHSWPLVHNFNWSALVNRKLRAPFIPKNRILEKDESPRPRMDSHSSISGMSTLSTESSKLFVHCGEDEDDWAESF